MPDDKPTHPLPVLLPEDLLREADRLAEEVALTAQALAQTLHYWADPAQRPTVGPTIDPSAVGSPMAAAETIVAALRQARAALAGGDSAVQRDEAELVGVVLAAASRCDNVGPEVALARALHRAAARLSTPVRMALREPELRELLTEAVALCAGLTTARGRGHSSAPRWIEPLFEVAVRVEVAGGDSLTPHGWYQRLKKRGLLPDKKGVR